MKYEKLTTLLYAVNESEAYQELAVQSIESFLYYEKRIRITIVVYGKCHRRLIHFISGKKEVQLIQRNSVGEHLSFGLKWLALREVLLFKHVVFVDADTFFFGALTSLLKSCRRLDFYAKPEAAIYKPFLRGEKLIQPRIDLKKINSLCRKLDLSIDPVIFNSSVMIFNNSSHRQVVQRLPQMLQLLHDFHTGRTEFPGSFQFIAEEVVGSIFFSKKPKLTVGIISDQLVTHFNQWTADFYGPIGAIMHIGHGHVLQFLEAFGLKESEKKFKDIYRKTFSKKEDYIHPLFQNKI